MTLPRPLRAVLRLVATLALTFLGLLLVTFVIGCVVDRCSSGMQPSADVRRAA